MRWKTRLWTRRVLVIFGVVLAGAFLSKSCLYVTEWDEERQQPPSVKLKLTDDRIEDKNPAFDETLVDSRPLDGWEVNQSGAVIKVDCPNISVNTEENLLVLRPSYREAIQAAAEAEYALLPSANLVDGAAKQFDDGLYACLDLACYQGKLGFGPSAPELVRDIFEILPEACPARAFLAAALELAGQRVELTSPEGAAKKELLKRFEQDGERSKPIGFYTWTPELKEVWRFLRFLQFEFDASNQPPDMPIPRGIAQALERDPALLEQYRAFNAFHGRLTNPLICLSLDALIGDDASLEELARRHGARRVAVSVFPPSTSRETELFDRLFGMGLPAGVNLMGELIARIRSGEIALRPDDEDGWYQYQVYALETMLLPGKGEEADKLLLMATYKKRLVEAFKALITKRRETHVRKLAIMETAGMHGEGPVPRYQVAPRLRVEPCATFYLRTARAYSFLRNFLSAAVGEETLKNLQGLREGGVRKLNLFEELDAVRERFYGLYVVACEDIGMRPSFLDGEVVDQEAAKQAALSWIERLEDEPDLVCDTRVALPILRDQVRGVTRLWATLGVRLARLDASYAIPPVVRPFGSDGPWKGVSPFGLYTSHYVIPVDEFAEFELPGMTSLTRDEFRAVCDEYETKDKILEALSKR